MLSLVACSIHSLDQLLHRVDRYHSHEKVARDVNNFRTAQSFGRLQDAWIGAV